MASNIVLQGKRARWIQMVLFPWHLKINIKFCEIPPDVSTTGVISKNKLTAKCATNKHLFKKNYLKSERKTNAK